MGGVGAATAFRNFQPASASSSVSGRGISTSRFTPQFKAAERGGADDVLQRFALSAAPDGIPEPVDFGGRELPVEIQV